MKTSLLFAFALLAAAVLRAEPAKEYQIAGAIVALTDEVITIEKGGEKWEIVRTPATKVDGELAVGRRVTIYYRMAATSVEAKPAANAGDADAGLSRAEKAAKRADEAAEKTRQKAKQ